MKSKLSQGEMKTQGVEHWRTVRRRPVLMDGAFLLAFDAQILFLRKEGTSLAILLS